MPHRVVETFLPVAIGFIASSACAMPRRREKYLSMKSAFSGIGRSLATGLICSVSAVTAAAESATATDAVQPVSLSGPQTLLIAGALVAAMICIYMVFFFGRRLQSNAFMRDSLVAAARQDELRILRREIDDLAKQGPLDATKPAPDGFGPAQQIWVEGVYVPYRDRLGYAPPEESEADRNARLAKLAKCEAWEAEERRRYQDLKDKIEIDAAKRAEAKVPTSMDISLLGGGWSFLLEFTTVIIIIFTLMVLGIAGIVSGKDITTILASIAGYVLGKATAQKDQDKTKAPPTTEPAPSTGQKTQANP